MLDVEAHTIQQHIAAHKLAAANENRAAARAMSASRGFKAQSASAYARLRRLQDRSNRREGLAADYRAKIEVLQNTLKRRQAALAAAVAKRNQDRLALTHAATDVKLQQKAIAALDEN